MPFNTRLLPVLVSCLSVFVLPSAAWGTDCNENGIDDTCDLSCEGACSSVSGCGESEDCNENGVPDECDIATVFAGTQGAGSWGG